MNRILYDILNDINEGIIILNEKFEIFLWNNYMKKITDINQEKVIYNNIYEVLPNLNKSYYNKAMSDILNSGNEIFFSAAMHTGLINDKLYLNLKISRIYDHDSRFLLLEFIDVTNQFVQINELKKYVQELYKVNKQLKEQETIIKNLAYYDTLTGVANRTLFYELAEKFLDNAKRNNILMGLMFIDVDKFKIINDTYGHQAGDEVLVKVANILKEATRKNDIVARHGGDEFLILLPYIKNVQNYEIIVSRIMNSKNKIINFNGKEIEISMSIGISFFPQDGDTIDKLIAKADREMYDAKNGCRKNRIICNMCNI